jgi:hypothetical protein
MPVTALSLRERHRMLDTSRAQRRTRSDTRRKNGRTDYGVVVVARIGHMKRAMVLPGSQRQQVRHGSVVTRNDADAMRLASWHALCISLTL